MERARTKDHVPPLLRGVGFLLVLITSLFVGVAEHRADAESGARLVQAKAKMDAMAETYQKGDRMASIAGEIRLLRLQLQDEDLADRVFENLWFQLLGTLGSAIVAASFLYEARMKWPRRSGPERSPPS